MKVAVYSCKCIVPPPSATPCCLRANRLKDKESHKEALVSRVCGNSHFPPYCTALPTSSRLSVTREKKAFFPDQQGFTSRQ